MKRSVIRRGRLAFTLVAATVAAAFFTPAASAAPGDLSYVGCTGNLSGCAPTNPAAALNGVRAVAMTPDGRHLYSVGSSGLSHFLVDANGNHTFAGCVGNLAGCTPTNPVTALVSGSVAGIAISADARHLYVATQSAVSHMRLDAAGNATFAGCIGSLAGCTPTAPASAISGAVGIAWKAGHLYVSSIGTNNVSRFTIQADGGLVFGGCWGSLAGCTALAVTGAVDTPYSLALAPGGARLYATSTGGDVARFAVAANGSLAFVGCTGSRVGCASTVPAGALNGLHGITFSPNGKTLYGASFSSGTVSWMDVDDTGNPTVRGCLGPAAGCTPTSPATALAGAFRVAPSPDGRQLYAVSQNSNAASHFQLAADGSPTFANCSGSLTGCSPIAPSNALANAFGVAIRPNGADMYVASFGANAISRFSIEPQPADPVVTPVPTPTPTPPVIVNPTGIDTDRDGFFAGQDCNDGNAGIRPGAVEVRGNRIDENCDGLADPFPTLTSGVVTKWNTKGSRLTLSVLQVTQQFPQGWKAEIKCTGSKCPFKAKRLKAAKVKRGAASIISSLTAKQRRFRAGQTVEVWVSAPGFNTTVKRYALKAGKIPTTQPFCVIAGETRPKKNCS